MKRVWAIAGASIFLLALAWWFGTSGDEVAPAPTVGVPSPLTPASIATGERTALTLELYLIPDGRIRAVPNSVRIGLGYVSPDDAASAPATLEAENAGPRRYEDLATIVQWEAVSAEALPDGRVKVGPVRLPHADRYSLTARGEDDLHFYIADFTAASTPPQSVSPLIGAGIRMHVDQGGAQVLLRRVGSTPPPASWQRIQQREAPALLHAFSDQALEIGSGEILAPLAPGPIEVVLQVDGVEAERKLLSLPAGRILDVRFDPTNQAAARAVSAELELEVVKEGSGEPISGLQVTWMGDPTAQTQISDVRGRVTFQGVDRQKTQQFNLQATPDKQGRLPEWPELQYLELTEDDLAGDSTSRIIRHRVELKPLRWLIARLPPEAAQTQRRRGTPYPLYVLQRQRDRRWLDTAAAHFQETRDGLAISIADEGTYRVAAVLSPWRVLESSAASTRTSRLTVDFAPARGTNVTVTMVRDGRPLAHAPAHASGPLRSLPPLQLKADANGRIVLPSATVSRLWLEIPGSDQVAVALTAPSVLVDFGAKQRPQ